MPLTYLLTQTEENWYYLEASESIFILKLVETEDPTAAHILCS